MKFIFGAVGVVAAFYVARKIDGRFFAQVAREIPRLQSSEDFQPREQRPEEEHLHVSLGEFLNGKQISVA